MLVGEQMLKRFKDSTVAVAGIGGVGGYAAEMLVRAGIGHLVILDSDTISVTNKNRQLLAVDSTVGKLKTDVLRSRMMDINPELDLLTIDRYILSDTVDESSGMISENMKMPEKAEKVATLLDGLKLSFVIDAIDTLGPKLSLIRYCMQNHIPLVSSMGAGAKYDVTKVRITDISKTYQCPLAYMVRKRLRKMGIDSGFLAVFSEELPDRNAIVLDESNNKKSQVGTISYLPAVFGCACAQAAIQSIISDSTKID